MPDDFDALRRILDTRYSCRGYLDRPVPRAQIDRIIAAAGRTPSWCNTQPWHLHLVSGPRLERLRAALPAFAAESAMQPDIPGPERYRGPYDARRKECGWQLYESVGVVRGDRAGSARQMLENFRFFGAPHLAIVTTEAELGPYGMLDCGGFITAFMLAARALGVASIAQAALAGCAPLLRAELAIPPQRQILCGISFGYEDPDHPANRFRTTRATPDDLTTWHD